MLSVFPARLRGRGAFTFLVAFALAGCSEARTAAQPSAALGGPISYLSARALDGLVFQPGTVSDIRPTGRIVEVQLLAARSPWELTPGTVTEAVTYNGTVPGPTIRATEGDTLRVTLVNKLQQDTSIHWHGLHIKNAMDGVPPYTQAPIGPGATFVYEFTVSHAAPSCTTRTPTRWRRLTTASMGS
ncbi:MAG: multicopper oxidase domain-containing protein [Chloroflexota bacterium]